MIQIDNNSYHVPRHVTFWGCGFSNTGDTRSVASGELRLTSVDCPERVTGRRWAGVGGGAGAKFL